MRQVLFGLFCLLLVSGRAFAHHPNEGNLTLESLIQEAQSKNLEIQEAEADSKSSAALAKASNSAFFPEISVEGGPLITKYDSENHNDTTLYGKAEWNIFSGGKDSAAKSKKEIESKISNIRLEFTKISIANRVSKIYYEMLFLLESISLKQKAIEMNQDQIKLANAKKNSGFTSMADVVEFELREATLKSDLKQLQLEQISKSRELALLLGRTEGSSSLSVQGHLVRDDRALNKDKILLLAFEKNSQILVANANLEINQKNTSIARAGFLPKIDALVKFGRIANEEKVFKNKNNYSVSVLFNLPIFSGFRSVNDLSSSEFEGQKSEIQQKKQEAEVKAEVEELYSKLISFRERLDLEEKTLSRSEEYYKITTAEYRRGVKNSPDMVAASEILINARIRNLEFRKEIQVTILDLFGVAGLNPENRSVF